MNTVYYVEYTIHTHIIPHRLKFFTRKQGEPITQQIAGEADLKFLRGEFPAYACNHFSLGRVYIVYDILFGWRCLSLCSMHFWYPKFNFWPKLYFLCNKFLVKIESFTSRTGQFEKKNVILEALSAYSLHILHIHWYPGTLHLSDDYIKSLV